MRRPNRIGEHREKAGLSLEQLAELTGLSPGYVSRMERGERNVSLKNLALIASALRVSQSALLQSEDDIQDIEAVFRQIQQLSVDRRARILKVLLALLDVEGFSDGFPGPYVAEFPDTPGSRHMPGFAEEPAPQQEFQGLAKAGRDLRRAGPPTREDGAGRKSSRQPKNTPGREE